MAMLSPFIPVYFSFFSLIRFLCWKVKISLPFLRTLTVTTWYLRRNSCRCFLVNSGPFHLPSWTNLQKQKHYKSVSFSCLLSCLFYFSLIYVTRCGLMFGEEQFIALWLVSSRKLQKRINISKKLHHCGCVHHFLLSFIRTKITLNYS